MGVLGTWNGTPQEAKRFMKAVAKNCACSVVQNGRCPPHRLLEDERVLNHLIFAYRIRERLILEEWQTRVTTLLPKPQPPA